MRASQAEAIPQSSPEGERKSTLELDARKLLTTMIERDVTLDGAGFHVDPERVFARMVFAATRRGVRGTLGLTMLR